MSRATMLQECDQEVQTLFPDLRRSIQKALAALLTGAVAEGCINLVHASAGAPGDAKDPSKLKRAQRLLANDRFDLNRVQRRLIDRALASQQGTVYILLDASTTGATRQQPGTMTLMFALAWHQRALPLLWRSWATTEPNQNWRAAIRRMLPEITALLPETVTPVLLTDRQFPGRPLLALLRAHGWHWILRVRKNFPLRLADGRCVRIGALAPRRGARHLAHGARVCDIPTNVVAIWRTTEREPWLLITDLPAVAQRCQEYRKRTWQEALFRDLKSYGWHWEKSKVKAPERVERLLAVLAVATLWMLGLGQRVIKRGVRSLFQDGRQRRKSRFQLGIAYLRRLMSNDQHVPCLLRLLPEASSP